MRKMILAAAMLSMTSAAMANPASSLSVQNATARSYSTQASPAREKRQAIMPILIGLGIVAGVTYLIVDHENDNDNDRPDSN